MLHAVKNISTLTPPKERNSTLIKYTISFSVERSFSEQGQMPNPSFLLLYDRMVNKIHQFQYPKRQNKRWKEWDLMHILFAWRLRTEVLACCYS
jgi:hypothetical protein